MASINIRPNRHFWIQWTAADGARKTLRLGKSTKRVAEQHQRVIESLLANQVAGLAMEMETAKFLSELPEVIQERYRKCGLIGASAATKPKKQTDLTSYLHSYFESRKTEVKSTTWTFYQHTRKRLLEYFGDNKLLAEVTASDARAFKIWLESTNKRDKADDKKPIKGLASNTVRRRLSLCRQIFKQAFEDGLISRNPFNGFKTSVRSNKEKQFYIDMPTYEKVLAKAPNTRWRVLLGLARLTAFRIPSEAAALKWEHIDWETHRLSVVESSKTEHHEARAIRYVPIPKSLEEDLAKLRTEKGPESEYVIGDINGQTNLRTTLEKIIKRAKVTQWPKLWQNLRASASTDFARVLPGHVAAAICGHTKQIAQEHYWTVTDTDLDRALSLFNAMQGQTAADGPLEPDVKPDVASVGNGSQGVASDDPKVHKSQGKRNIPQDSMKDQWAILDSNQRPQRCQLKTSNSCSRCKSLVYRPF